MKRKRVEKEKKLEWSQASLNIFHEIEHGHRNILIEATAGSAKTTSLVEGCKRISNKIGHSRICLLAFNKSIVEELVNKVDDERIRISTIHALGHNCLIDNQMDGDVRQDKYKYIFQKLIRRFQGSGKLTFIPPKFLDNLVRLCDITRLTLTDLKDVSERELMIEIYGLDPSINTYAKYYYPLVMKALEIGIASCSEIIDFCDMLWLPVQLKTKIKFMEYDYLFVDEAQDSSKCLLELVLLHQSNPNGRLIFAGDVYQSIMLFAGSNSRSLQDITERTNAKVMRLPTSYRLPKFHVSLAQTVNPEIEVYEHAIDGVLQTVSLEELIELTPNVDAMIICRTWAPLLLIRNLYLKANKPVRLMGDSIIIQVERLVQKLAGRVTVGSSSWLQQFQLTILKYEDELIEMSNKKDGVNFNSILTAAEHLEIIKCVLISLDPSTANCSTMLDAVNQMFKSDSKLKEGIKLQTIHASKGLEANFVGLINLKQTPKIRPRFATPEILEQERNLLFVGYTRSKHSLYIVEKL